MPETWVQDFLKQNSSITTNLVLDRSLGAVTALVIESTNPEYVGYVITQYQGKKFARKLQIENLSEKITELNKRLKTYQNTLVS